MNIDPVAVISGLLGLIGTLGGGYAKYVVGQMQKQIDSLKAANEKLQAQLADERETRAKGDAASEAEATKKVKNCYENLGLRIAPLEELARDAGKNEERDKGFNTQLATMDKRIDRTDTKVDGLQKQVDRIEGRLEK
jgi:chromosome segregation ATPase